MMLNYQGTKRSLQEAVNEYCSSVSTVLCDCVCKRNISINPTLVPTAGMYYTEHNETFAIIGTPDILHIKVRDRSRANHTIVMSERFSLCGVEYAFKSGMLYTGSGNKGHWRALVKEGDMLLLYNDEHVPVKGCLSDLKLGTDFIFGKIKTVEKTRDNNAIKCLESREITLAPGIGYSCEVCSKSFTRRQYLNRHVLYEHNIHRCNHCEDSFLTDDLLFDHVTEKHMTEDFTCVICSKYFESVDAVQLHMKVFHNCENTVDVQNVEVPNMQSCLENGIYITKEGGFSSSKM